MSHQCYSTRVWMWTAAMVAAAGLGVGAQTALRVKGMAGAVNAAGVPAAVELEALHGYRGLEFVGQKTFKTRASAKGQWSVLGVTSGVWMFAAHTPGHLPQVLLLPVQFTQKNPASAVGAQLPWDVGFELALLPADGPLARAARAAVDGDRQGALTELAAVAESNDPDELIAGGELALYVRASAAARAMFLRATTIAPVAPRAQLGLASSALMDGAWDEAGKRLWNAREQGVSNGLKRAVGAAITELQRISGGSGSSPCVPGATRC